MGALDFDNLVPSHAPQPWLAVVDPGREDWVYHVAADKVALDIPGLREQLIEWVKQGSDIVAMRDDPELHVQYHGGLYTSGGLDATPAHLAARRNWFLRYRRILAPHLTDPKPAMVQLFEKRPWIDLLSTMRSSRAGPFPFIKDADWPRCGHCQEPMAFIGVLDFRDFARVGTARLPRGALVLHGCDQCTIPCLDDQSRSLIWITEVDKVDARGTGDQNAVEIGIPWETIEFPTPACYAEQLSDDPAFLKEIRIYENFTCPLNKVGGHVQWLQSDCTPIDRNGQPMKYIGQLLGSRDVELADSGIVYLFWSDETKQTEAILQFS